MASSNGSDRRADIAAARPADAMDQPGRRLALEARPRLLPEDPLDFRQRRQRVKQAGHEAEADPASIGHATRASHNGRGRYEPGCRRLRGHAHIETALAGSPRCASQPPSIVFWISDERSDKSDLMRDISASVLAASPFSAPETRTARRTRARNLSDIARDRFIQALFRIGSRRAPSSPKARW